MIQRIQSVYLLIAAILVVLVNFFPLAHCVVGEGFYTVTAMGVDASALPEFTGTAIWCWGTVAFSIVAFLLIVAALFGYKDRVGQMRNCVLAILAIIVYYVFFGVEAWVVNDVAGSFPVPSVTAQFPLIAIILLFLAGRAIKRDEDLVRSMDRIR